MPGGRYSEFDLRELFRDTFGYNAPDLSKINLPKAKERLEVSQLGQPYYMNDFLNREFFLPVTINGYLIPFAVIGMTWRKTIESTPLPERGGSVNEIISIEDYLFNVKGIIVNESNDFPEQQIIDLHDLFKVNASVEMRSVITDIVLNGACDHRVLIKSVPWPPVSGVEHAKPFEIEVMSDMIFDLEIE